MSVPEIELSEQDVADLAGMGIAPDGQQPDFHPILQVWREVLKPAQAELNAPITPQWATRIIGGHLHLTFKDMLDFRELFFGKLAKLEQILLDEIATDDDCLSYTTPEEDVEENSGHYLNLLRDWQIQFLRWEMAWDCQDPLAAVELAATSEVHRMFFSQTGIATFLDNIKFEFTDQDQANLAEALEAVRDEAGR
jgi:hypothetical protein